MLLLLLVLALVTGSRAATICTFSGTDGQGNTIPYGSLCDGTYKRTRLCAAAQPQLLRCGFALGLADAPLWSRTEGVCQC